MRAQQVSIYRTTRHYTSTEKKQEDINMESHKLSVYTEQTALVPVIFVSDKCVVEVTKCSIFPLSLFQDIDDVQVHYPGIIEVMTDLQGTNCCMSA